MVYANIISGLNSFYKRICIWLNDNGGFLNILFFKSKLNTKMQFIEENYREQSTHENHLIFKIVSFQFINSYLSLFYIAFYLRDAQLLQAVILVFLYNRIHYI